MKPYKSYFVSDLHLGMDTMMPSEAREKLFVSWLERHRVDMKALYLVGDVFDYWYEYKNVIPRGYARLFGQLAALSDSGVEIHFFKGNHDMWVYDYFQKELGIAVHDELLEVEIDQKKFVIGHGDQIGPQDRSYRVTRSVLRHKVSQWLFSTLHPRVGISLMKWFSKSSRESEPDTMGKSKYTDRMIEFLDTDRCTLEFDYVICGHLHDPIYKKIESRSGLYCNLGDWMFHFTYAVWDGAELRLEKVDVLD